ncbi:hypothetical protein X275_06595 [Marinitoga sp. 1197]|uniref:hypothetical protein n=1 Tax=Marinitoga sp. 1197 TaxID=1428449 RepID=UPI0006411FAC|nr:hypothetical protein [Marinitoga sp. 1197]KLO22078.1 hypothetical protein X275_06595 [Marinitoga sp. 1197]
MRKNLFLIIFIFILLIPSIYIIKNTSVKKMYSFKNLINSSYMFKDNKGNIYVGFRNNKLYSFSKNLKKNWEKNFDSNVLSFIPLEDKLILTTNNSNLYMLNLKGKVLKKINFDYKFIILKGKITDNKFIVLYQDKNYLPSLGEMIIENSGNIQINEFSLYLDTYISAYEYLKIYPLNNNDYFYFKKTKDTIIKVIISHDEEKLPYVKKVIPIKTAFIIKDPKYIKYGFPIYYNEKILFSINNFFYIQNTKDKSEIFINLENYYKFKDYKPKINSNIIYYINNSYFTTNFGDLFEVSINSGNVKRYKIKAYGDSSLIKKYGNKLYILSGNNFIIFDTKDKTIKRKEFGDSYFNFVIIDENNIILINNGLMSKLLNL